MSPDIDVLFYSSTGVLQEEPMENCGEVLLSNPATYSDHLDRPFDVDWIDLPQPVRPVKEAESTTVPTISLRFRHPRPCRRSSLHESQSRLDV